MSRGITAPEFAVYAKQQIADADEVLAEHVEHEGDLCSCGRPAPCPVAIEFALRRDHFIRKLANLLSIQEPAPPHTTGVIARVIKAILRTFRGEWHSEQSNGHRVLLISSGRG